MPPTTSGHIINLPQHRRKMTYMPYSYISTYTTVYLTAIYDLLLYVFEKKCFPSRTRNKKNMQKNKQKKQPNKQKNKTTVTTSQPPPFCHYLQSCSFIFSYLTPFSLWNVNTTALWGLSAPRRDFSIATAFVSWSNNVNIQTTASCKSKEQPCSRCVDTGWVLKWYDWIFWARAHPWYLLIVFTQQEPETHNLPSCSNHEGVPLKARGITVKRFVIFSSPKQDYIPCRSCERPVEAAKPKFSKSSPLQKRSFKPCRIFLQSFTGFFTSLCFFFFLAFKHYERVSYIFNR